MGSGRPHPSFALLSPKVVCFRCNPVFGAPCLRRGRPPPQVRDVRQRAAAEEANGGAAADLPPAPPLPAVSFIWNTSKKQAYDYFRRLIQRSAAPSAVRDNNAGEMGARG